MSNWNDYAREEVERPQPGDYRCHIVAAEEATSKTSGKPMIVVTVRLNGTNVNVKNYIVKNQYFNRNMTALFDAFPAIGEGNFNLLEWVGAIGAGKFDTDEQGYLKLKWFLKPEQAMKLPEWVGEIPERQTVTELEDDDEDMPFC